MRRRVSRSALWDPPWLRQGPHNPAHRPEGWTSCGFAALAPHRFPRLGLRPGPQRLVGFASSSQGANGRGSDGSEDRWGHAVGVRMHSTPPADGLRTHPSSSSKCAAHEMRRFRWENGRVTVSHIGPGSTGGRVRASERVALAEAHAPVWALYRSGITSYRRIAALTRYSERTVGRIIRKCLNELMLSGDPREQAAELWAELELVKEGLRPEIFRELEDGTLMPPDKDVLTSWCKVTSLQMEIIGVRKPTFVMFDPPPSEENEEQVEYIERMKRAMDAVDRVAREGYGSGRDEAISDQTMADLLDRDVPIDAEATESTAADSRPPLLAALEDCESIEESEPDEEPAPAGRWMGGKFFPDGGNGKVNGYDPAHTPMV